MDVADMRSSSRDVDSNAIIIQIKYGLIILKETQMCQTILLTSVSTLHVTVKVKSKKAQFLMSMITNNLSF